MIHTTTHYLPHLYASFDILHHKPKPKTQNAVFKRLSDPSKSSPNAQGLQMNKDCEPEESCSWISIALFLGVTIAKTCLAKNSTKATLSNANGQEIDLLNNDEEEKYTHRRMRSRLSFDHTNHRIQKFTKKHESHRHFESNSSYITRSISSTSARSHPSAQNVPSPLVDHKSDCRNDMKAYRKLQDLMDDNAKASQSYNEHLEEKYRNSTFTERFLNRINRTFSSDRSQMISHSFSEDGEENEGRSNAVSNKSRFSEWRCTYNSKIMPNRLIMVRHGQSEGNVNEAIYSEQPDNQIPLTNLGWDQARMAGQALRKQMLNKEKDGSTVHFVVSPYVRTMETFHGLASAWCDPDIEFGHIGDQHKRKMMWYSRLAEMGITWHEDPRIREQDFGNYQNQETMNKAKKERHKFGVFYYRFPNGESASDVYDRVSTFLDSLWRSFDANRSQNYVLGKYCFTNVSLEKHGLNFSLKQTFACVLSSDKVIFNVIVTHGISVRVLLMRYFRYSIDQFNMLANPKNCEMIILGHDGQGNATFISKNLFLLLFFL
jgi:broad specificity phosphatase PhoE